MPKMMVSLRSIFYYKYDRSTQSLDPEALDGQYVRRGTSMILCLSSSQQNFMSYQFVKKRSSKRQ